MINLTDAERKALTGITITSKKGTELREIMRSDVRYSLQKHGLIDGREFSQKLTARGLTVRAELLGDMP